MQGREVGAGGSAVHQMPADGLGIDVPGEGEVGELGLAGEGVCFQPASRGWGEKGKERRGEKSVIESHHKGGKSHRNK